MNHSKEIILGDLTEIYLYINKIKSISILDLKIAYSEMFSLLTNIKKM